MGMNKPVVVDIELSDDAPPAIAYPRGSFPSDPVFSVVIPPGGCEEDARMFAICLPSSTTKAGARKGKRTQRAAEWHPIETLDHESIPRLFERGVHPGDFRIIGSAMDRAGHERNAPLVFFDFSHGSASQIRSSTDPELRRTLAQACESVGTKAWKGAAEIADPSGLLRKGVVSISSQQSVADAPQLNVTAADPIRDFRLLNTPELLDEIGREARSILYGCPDLPANGPSAAFLKRDIDSFLGAFRRKDQDLEAAYTTLAGQMDALIKSGKDAQALNRLGSGYGPGALPWRNLFAQNGLIAVLMDRARHPGRKHPPTEQVAALPDWAKSAVTNPRDILLRRPSSLEEADYALSTLKYPYFPLKANRMAASPGLRRLLDEEDETRLTQLLENSELLVKAFDEIENSYSLKSEARDSLAIGWHAIAYSMLSRFPEVSESVRARAPNFVTEDARTRPFLTLSQPTPSVSPAPRP